MTSRMRLKRKEVDDVLGGDEMWAHADRTQGIPLLLVAEELTNFPFSSASCDKCNFNSAFFYQLQIRSADEPMTTCAIPIV
jgi:DNA-directed RNA polymerase III subunit RPC11